MMPVFKDVADQVARLPKTSFNRDDARHPDEVTVRFRRWTQVGITAFQRNDCAGFLRAKALELIRRGKADAIDPQTGAVILLQSEAPVDGELWGGAPVPSRWGAPVSKADGWPSFFTRESDPPNT